MFMSVLCVRAPEDVLERDIEKSFNLICFPSFCLAICLCALFHSIQCVCMCVCVRVWEIPYGFKIPHMWFARHDLDLPDVSLSLPLSIYSVFWLHDARYFFAAPFSICLARGARPVGLKCAFKFAIISTSACACGRSQTHNAQNSECGKGFYTQILRKNTCATNEVRYIARTCVCGHQVTGQHTLRAGRRCFVIWSKRRATKRQPKKKHKIQNTKTRSVRLIGC